MKRKNLTGKTFGLWKVKHEVEQRGILRFWLCECKCGTVREVSQQGLVSGKSRSCGCAKRKDLTGKKFGKLTALTFETRNQRTRWLCECECGKKVEVLARDLLNGNTTSCGCTKVERAQNLLEPHRIDDVIVPLLQKKLNSNNKTGVKGVFKKVLKNGEERFVAHLTVGGKFYNLGSYKTLEEAKKARKQAEELYHKPLIDKYKKQRG
jgi:hypothetical protein